jgi:hypothetical protein
VERADPLRYRPLEMSLLRNGQPVRWGIVNRRPFAFLILAFALILAPLGLCLGHGAKAAIPTHSAAATGHGPHGAPAASADRRQHEDGGERHFCAECRPDSFVKASAAYAQGLASIAAIDAALPAVPKMVAPEMARPVFAHERSPPPRPPSRRYRIRLQV